MENAEDKQKNKNKISLNDQNPYKNNNTPSLTIKTFQSKFIFYLNELNAGIQNCKRKTNRKLNHNDQRRKSFDHNDNSSIGNMDQQGLRMSRKINRTPDKRRNSSRQYTIISGQRVNGKIHGRAILELQNGARFKGQVQQGEIKQGNLQFPDGSSYQGGFKNSLFHGEGRLRLCNNTEYKTEFNNGIMARKGQIFYSNGDIYKGQILNYKKHGQGQLKLKNGNKYIGSFQQGQITGFGIYYMNQQMAAKGTWHKGQFLGLSQPINSILDA